MVGSINGPGTREGRPALATPEGDRTGLRLDRIYDYRFRDIDPAKKSAAWRPIAAFIAKKLGGNGAVLDPAAGMCEFINHAPARERWAVDASPRTRELAAPGVRVEIGSSTRIELPPGHFTSIFVSNFLEHLENQDEVATFLARMHRALAPGGRIGVMGPNFRACPREYFDFADHKVILTDRSCAEHLFGAGFEIVENHPRFLPMTFRQRLPVSALAVRVYLGFPLAWRVLGKQFLLIGEKRV